MKSEEARSDLFMYLTYKYIFLYVSAFMIAIPVKQKNYSTENLLIFGILFLVFVGLHLFTSRYVFRATVSREGIQLKDKVISWHEIESIVLIGHLYCLKSQKKKYFFPTDFMPRQLLGTTLKTSSMHQLITKIMK